MQPHQKSMMPTNHAMRKGTETHPEEALYIAATIANQ
jgi:hypothetical protein